MNYFKESVLICCVVVFCSTAVAVASYKTYSALNSILFTNMPEPAADDVHSEYYFGKCLSPVKDLIVHDHLDYEDIYGQMIIRGYLDINGTDLPNCVYIKATSHHGDMVRYNSYKFTVCFIEIVHNSKGNTSHYFYYEWFVPVEMQEGIDWELFFYIAE